MFLCISNYVTNTVHILPLCMFVVVFVSFDYVLLIITACVFVLDESILGIFHIMFSPIMRIFLHCIVVLVFHYVSHLMTKPTK